MGSIKAKHEKEITVEDCQNLQDAWNILNKLKERNYTTSDFSTTEDALMKAEKIYSYLWEVILDKYFDFDIIKQTGTWSIDYETRVVTLEVLKEAYVLPSEQEAKISKMQEELGDYIKIEDYGGTVTTHGRDNLSKGCISCKNGTWWCYFVETECNAFCKFCSQEKSTLNTIESKRSGFYTDRLTIEDKLYYEKNKDLIEGVSYSGGEPLFKINKILEMSEWIQEQSNGEVYQWVYTNGILLTKDILKDMCKSGIKEVRINLAATDFSSEIVKKLDWVKEMGLMATVEVPSVPEVYENLVVKGLLTKLPIDQLNLAEFELRHSRNWSNYVLKDTPIVRYTKGYSCPAFSWEITYRILKEAKEKDVSYIINDCGNNAKNVQIVMRQFGKPIQY